MIEVKDSDLRQAAEKGMDAFIQVFTDAYEQAAEGMLSAGTMSRPLLPVAFSAKTQSVRRCSLKRLA